MLSIIYWKQSRDLQSMTWNWILLGLLNTVDQMADRAAVSRLDASPGAGRDTERLSYLRHRTKAVHVVVNLRQFSQFDRNRAVNLVGISFTQNTSCLRARIEGDTPKLGLLKNDTASISWLYECFAGDRCLVEAFPGYKGVSLAS